MEPGMVFNIIWTLISFGVGFVLCKLFDRNKEITVDQALEVLRKNGWQEVKDIREPDSPENERAE